MVSHPETGSDSPIGSDRDRGRDSYSRDFELPSHDCKFYGRDHTSRGDNFLVWTPNLTLLVPLESY